ncbi:MAG: ATP-binding protein, partial [Clostridia bacterium]|nr:ATP-binding protein [Clostridia bacterium]
VEGDENRIIQIIYNIIGNAVKFTPKGQITIDCIQEKEYILIKVEDTGIGIDDEYHKNLFVSY